MGQISLRRSHHRRHDQAERRRQKQARTVLRRLQQLVAACADLLALAVVLRWLSSLTGC
jgi:hypothetical protein